MDSSRDDLGMEWTDEQRAVIDHARGVPARIQAGPGTGKSTTVLALAERLADGQADDSVRLATFTRAATTELAAKAVQGEISVPVTTVHSFALRILVKNQQWSRLPLPLRIPDHWEFDRLIHDDLRARLAPAFPNVRKTTVRRLESEMAARWEAMDDSLLLAEVDQQLRNAYVAAWTRQREVFGYSLFAEMPWYALELVEDHPEADLLGVQTLVVDEYQDLNRCEVGLLKALSSSGITIIGVGDEEQSIYSWRMAAPEGIRRFVDDFPGACDYPLSVSQRCARSILAASQRVIAIAPGRDPNRPPVTPAKHNPEGDFAYLRLSSAQAERAAMARLLKHHHGQGTPYESMAVLIRSDYQGRWSAAIRQTLTSEGVPHTDIEAALEPLHTDDARELLAVARLVFNPSDDLAWWTLLKLRRGVADTFLRLVADAAWTNGRRFHEEIDALADGSIPGATAQSMKAAATRVAKIKTVLAEIAATQPPDDPAAWVAWLREVAQTLEIPVAAELDVLFAAASDAVPPDGGIADLISQLEPIARDLALEAPGVSVMTVARSKGLTLDVVVTLGVEAELFPSPMTSDPEEDRRLLYVAMTRAREATYLLMAKTRNDGTAYSGAGTSINSRSRCDFLSKAGISPTDGAAFLQAL
jgi:DNA helicase-2/ATP-dependent DNA helicase PcrA